MIKFYTIVVFWIFLTGCEGNIRARQGEHVSRNDIRNQHFENSSFLFQESSKGYKTSEDHVNSFFEKTDSFGPWHIVSIIFIITAALMVVIVVGLVKWRNSSQLAVNDNPPAYRPPETSTTNSHNWNFDFNLFKWW